MSPAKPKCLLFLLGTNHFTKHSGVFFRSSRPEVFCKKRCSWKEQAETCNFILKETLAQVLSCEFCEISEKTFFHRTPVAASDSYRLSYFITRGKRIWFEFEQILNKSFHWGRCYWQYFPRSWDPTEALIQWFIPSYGISKFSRLWSSDKVLFIVFIFWLLGFVTIYYYMKLFL